jgi:uroporphyrinogen decarboxylase
MAMPVASFPGGQITGATVGEMVSQAGVQVEAILALQQSLGTQVVFTCMDLSVEAEAFGAEVVFSDDEVPTVVGRGWRGFSGDVGFPDVPEVGAARTAVQLETVSGLKRSADDRTVMAGVTGPFSMASRLLGIAETLVGTAEDPDRVEAMVERCAGFLLAYVLALREAGADGVLVAEPTAGLLAPRTMSRFSSRYVRSVAEAVAAPGFTVILHNCAARAVHLPALLEAGVDGLHVGAPMDLEAALEKVPAKVWVCGNVDPASVLVSGTPDAVRAAVAECRARTAGHANYVLSSGCDVPRCTPLENLRVLMDREG